MAARLFGNLHGKVDGDGRRSGTATNAADGDDTAATIAILFRLGAGEKGADERRYAILGERLPEVFVDAEPPGHETVELDVRSIAENNHLDVGRAYRGKLVQRFDRVALDTRDVDE